MYACIQWHAPFHLMPLVLIQNWVIAVIYCSVYKVTPSFVQQLKCTPSNYYSIFSSVHRVSIPIAGRVGTGTVDVLQVTHTERSRGLGVGQQHCEVPWHTVGFPDTLLAASSLVLLARSPSTMCAVRPNITKHSPPWPLTVLARDNL